MVDPDLTVFVWEYVILFFAGAIGYMGTSAFVRKIYTNVKID